MKVVVDLKSLDVTGEGSPEECANFVSALAGRERREEGATGPEPEEIAVAPASAEPEGKPAPRRKRGRPRKKKRGRPRKKRGERGPYKKRMKPQGKQSEKRNLDYPPGGEEALD